MKHLLIILSLLLLTSPVIGQESGVLYQYETSSGIQWKTFGDEKVQPMYKGEIKYGKMDGLGVLIYPYDGKSVVGEWKHGWEWNTKHTRKDGKLLGKFEYGKWIGSWGVLCGTWMDGKRVWFEKCNKGEKDIYVGDIKDGKPNGQGTYTLSNGENYVGECKNGYKNGYGTFSYSIGSKYVGEYKDGKKWNGMIYDRYGDKQYKYRYGEMGMP